MKIRASFSIALAVATLAACGDDTSATGGGGGSGGASTATGQGGDGVTSSQSVGTGGGDGGGGEVTYDEVCTEFCVALQEVADGLECGDLGPCDQDYCDEDPSEACLSEQIAAYQCLASDVSEMACFCEGEGEVECEDICDAEFEALDACEAPVQNACSDADTALFEGSGCDSPSDFYSDCVDIGDSAAAAGCGEAFDAFVGCVEADGGASCTCEDAGSFADCDGLCADELDATVSCIDG